MRESILALMSIEGLGPGVYRNLCETFGDAKTVLELDRPALQRDFKLSPAIVDSIVNKEYLRSLDRQLEWMNKHHANYVTLADADYPEVLRHIYDAPPMLMYKGKLNPEDNVAFAVVGTRYPDEYGKQMTLNIAGGITEKGICIVSGMARGIDTAAHYAALKAESRTIAVLGTPLNKIYPSENRMLFEEICNRGLVCSEIPIGHPHVPANFIRRNRIISGLSRGVVVTQAGSKSGAIVTALNANEQNRDVFAVPGDCLKGRHTGCHRLIRLGAKIVEKAEDVLCEYSFLKERMSGQEDCFIGTVQKTPLNKQEEILLACLGKDPVYIDRLLESCALKRADVMKILLDLEIKGYVQRGKGNYYKRMI